MGVVAIKRHSIEAHVRSVSIQLPTHVSDIKQTHPMSDVMESYIFQFYRTLFRSDAICLENGYQNCFRFMYGQMNVLKGSLCRLSVGYVQHRMLNCTVTKKKKSFFLIPL